MTKPAYDPQTTSALAQQFGCSHPRARRVCHGARLRCELRPDGPPLYNVDEFALALAALDAVEPRDVEPNARSGRSAPAPEVFVIARRRAP